MSDYQDFYFFVCTYIELSYILKIETLINKGFPKCKSHTCGSVSSFHHYPYQELPSKSHACGSVSI